MPASERYGRKGQEVTKGKYEKDHFSSSRSSWNGRDGRIDGKRRRAVFLRDPGAGGDGPRAGGLCRSGTGLCGARASRVRSAHSGSLRAAGRLCAAGGVFGTESLLPAGTRGSVWF